MIYKLVEECSENINEHDTIDIIPLNAIPLNVYKKVCNSCMINVVKFVVVFYFLILIQIC